MVGEHYDTFQFVVAILFLAPVLIGVWLFIAVAIRLSWRLFKERT